MRTAPLMPIDSSQDPLNQSRRTRCGATDTLQSDRAASTSLGKGPDGAYTERTLAGNWMSAADLPIPTATVCAEDAQPEKSNPLCCELGAHRRGVEESRCLVIEAAITGIKAGLTAGIKRRSYS